MDDGNGRDDSQKILTFALLVQRVEEERGTTLRIKTKNEGFNVAEILLIMETWLEHAKEGFKKPIREGM